MSLRILAVRLPRPYAPQPRHRPAATAAEGGDRLQTLFVADELSSQLDDSVS